MKLLHHKKVSNYSGFVLDSAFLSYLASETYLAHLKHSVENNFNLMLF